MFKRLRIAILKAHLRAAYEEYMTERSYVDCGAAVTEAINPRISECRDRCNAVLPRLARLDPDNCPCTRIA